MGRVVGSERMAFRVQGERAAKVQKLGSILWVQGKTSVATVWAMWMHQTSRADSVLDISVLGLI